MQKTNQVGLDLIKRFEGLRLEAYQDAAGIWTIGYGHTASARPGLKITAQTADELLRRDLEVAERAVSRNVIPPLGPNQFSALVSFVFNVGPKAFASSSMLGLLNDQHYAGAADQFPRWNKAGGVVLPGLVKRRAAERALFLEDLR